MKKIGSYQIHLPSWHLTNTNANANASEIKKMVTKQGGYRAPLPEHMKKVNPCKQCGAHMIKLYDYKRDFAYQRCSNCGFTMWPKDMQFPAKFTSAKDL